MSLSQCKIIKVEKFSLSHWKDLEKNNITSEVAKIIKQVKTKKEKAIFELTFKQTGVSLANLKAPYQAIKSAKEKLSALQIKAIQLAKKNIEDYHKKTKPTSWQQEKKDKIWGQNFSPIEKVGIYIPGGLAAYPSSVLMNVIPAQIAGSSRIIVVSPPAKNSLPHESILATLGLLGIKEVFSVGGAQAIAAMAFGTETIPKVLMISGPGNQFVQEAKKQLFGEVNIDSIAGPSEVAILLEKKNDVPSFWVAQDLIAQAEHGSDSKAILITDDEKKAREVSKLVTNIIKNSSKKKILEKSITHHGLIVITKNNNESIELVNKIAPEHLQILATDKSILAKIKNAGAVFWGKNSPVAMGDYIAGPNHTLPTTTTAKFFSALNVNNFMKCSSYLEYKNNHFKEEFQAAMVLAEMEEQLEHRNSIKLRFE